MKEAGEEILMGLIRLMGLGGRLNFCGDGEGPNFQIVEFQILWEGRRGNFDRRNMKAVEGGILTGKHEIMKT